MATTGGPETIRDTSLTGLMDRIEVILDAVTIEGPLTLTEIVVLTEMPKTTVHRLLVQMVRYRWLTRIGNNYELGVRLFELGTEARQGHWFHRLVRPHLEELRARTRLLVHLAFLDGESVIWWERLGDVPPGHVPTVVGSRTAAHLTASGKVLLSVEDDAFLDRTFGEHLQVSTARTCRTRNELAVQVRAARNSGLAFDHGENVHDVGCIAAPIVVRQQLSSTGRRIAVSVSVCGPLDRIQKDRQLQRDVFTCVTGVQRDLSRNPVATDY
ncbi:IclR family transcriptional regulator [Nocardia sp. NPDC006630]|uniref:IclR family transcriptional regulator n=1 Tax=Nocardia sp. NPDC006630 TaxID=3157181 RepID=UPI0033B69C80